MIDVNASFSAMLICARAAAMLGEIFEDERRQASLLSRHDSSFSTLLLYARWRWHGGSHGRMEICLNGSYGREHEYAEAWPLRGDFMLIIIFISACFITASIITEQKPKSRIMRRCSTCGLTAL